MTCRCFTMLLGVGLTLGTPVFAQVVIAPSVKSASEISQADQSQIQQYVAAQASKLKSTDPAAQSQGRDALVSGATADSPSVAFSDAYAQAVNDALLPLMSDASLRVRLNAAIAASRIAARTNSLRLKPLAEKLINDPSDAIVLWGAKSYGSLLPVELRSGVKSDSPLLKSLLPAIKDQLSAPIAQEAYDAMRLNLLQNRRNLTPEMLKAVIPSMQSLLAARVAQYQAGVPESPVVDTVATTFLVDSDVWRQHDADERNRTTQLMLELISAAAARTASFDGDRANKESLLQAIRLTASGIRVLASSLNKPAIDAVALPVTKLDASMPSATVIRTCDSLIVQVVADLPGVKRPSMTVSPLVALE